MSKMIKGRTPLLALILFVLTLAQAWADPVKVVVIPMAADKTALNVGGDDGFRFLTE